MVNSINTNIAAYFAQANIGISSNLATKSVARLSSGNRIVNASDDVAALSIGTSLRTSVSTLKIAKLNAAQGATLLQIADGALGQVAEILQRQKAIAIQAGSGSLSDTDRGFLDQEFQALVEEIDRLSSSTNFNNVNLIDGSLQGSNPLRSDAGANTATITGFATQGTLITAVAFADGAGSLGDTTFYGDLSQGTFEVQAGTPEFTVSYTLNGSTYLGTVEDASSTGTSLVLTNGEGTITFTLAADVSGTYSVDATGAAAFQTDLEDAFEGASAFSNRTLLETDASGVAGSAIEASDTNGTLLEGMDGNDIIVRSQFWDGLNAPTISDFSVSDPAGGVGSKFSVVINGRTYTTEALIDATDISASANITAGSGDNLRFYLDGDSATNPNEYISIDLGDSVQVIDVDTEENVTSFLNDLNDIFGRSGGGLSFQVGANSSDSLQVLIAAATTFSLYDGADLNVLTQEDAETASTTLEDALAAVSAIRAGVGAAQSRFNFAQANIDTAVQNQDAARAELLETDIASESTAYATAQVKLQAGISVLAQANQQLQSLLKLIG
jgi:flagellin